MNLLLDTNAFVWWSDEDDRLSKKAQAAISNATEVHVSIASAWEIAIKVGKGKWPEAEPLLDRFEEIASGQGFGLLEITVDDVRRAGRLGGELKDPFDKLVTAQALNRGLTLVTSDRLIASLGARTVW